MTRRYLGCVVLSTGHSCIYHSQGSIPNICGHDYIKLVSRGVKAVWHCKLMLLLMVYLPQNIIYLPNPVSTGSVSMNTMCLDGWRTADHWPLTSDEPRCLNCPKVDVGKSLCSLVVIGWTTSGSCNENSFCFEMFPTIGAVALAL